MLYNLHTHIPSNASDITEIVNVYPYEDCDRLPCFSTGIHPWYINEGENENHIGIIEQRLQMSNCLALGECGLDKRIDTSLLVQQEIFEKQLLIAQHYKKPVILHCVAAFQELIEIKNRLNINVPMIIHGFSKNEQVAKQLLDNGLYLSFGKYLMRNEDLSDVLVYIPADRFFLETDTAEESIADVYKKAATARNTDIEELKIIVDTNFKKVFKNGAMDGES